MTTLNKKTAFSLFEEIAEDLKATRKELEADDELGAAEDVLLALENVLLDSIRSVRTPLYENE